MPRAKPVDVNLPVAAVRPDGQVLIVLTAQRRLVLDGPGCD